LSVFGTLEVQELNKFGSLCGRTLKAKRGLFHNQSLKVRDGNFLNHDKPQLQFIDEHIQIVTMAPANTGAKKQKKKWYVEPV